MAPHTPKAKWYSSRIPQLPKDPVLDFSSFWRAPYNITQVISEMTQKIREKETHKELIVHYDCTKPFFSPPGGFVPPTNKHLAPMQLLIDTPFQSSTAKCHSCFSEAPITCTPTVGPVSVSRLVPRVQPAPQSILASPPVANDNPLESSAALEEETFPNRSPDSTLPYSFHHPEVINSSNCPFNTAKSSTSFLDDPYPEQLNDFLLPGLVSP